MIDFENEFYYKSGAPEIKERTQKRLKELEKMGLYDIGFSEFGNENIRGGILLESVWYEDDYQWKLHKKNTKKLISDNIKYYGDKRKNRL